MLVREIRQWKWFRGSRIAKSPWDLTDFLILALMGATIGLHVAYAVQPSVACARWLVAVSAVEVLGLWFRVLQYGMGVQPTGPLIRCVWG